jgi:hydroxymethylpyrimidine pyrophosphatase-like HAD family hydrolase
MDSLNAVDGTSVDVSIHYSVSSSQTPPSDTDELKPQPVRLMDCESRFYNYYPWSLQVFPTLREVHERLRGELKHLETVEEEWQRREVEINIFLLACAVTESIDDFLLGKTCDLSKIKDMAAFAGPVLRGVEGIFEKRRNLRSRSLKSLFTWRTVWEQTLQPFVRGLLTGRVPHNSVRELESLLAFPLPVTLLKSRPRIPAAFHAQDLTHLDIVTLGDKFISSFPDRARPVMIVGLRTAGSYFAPVLHAHLSSQGYEDVSSMSIRPKSGIGYWEMLSLKRGAKRKALVIVIDEPGGTGTTYARAVDCISGASIAKKDIVLLLPIHPTVRNWSEKPGYLRLSRFCILPLEPEEYYKHKLLQLESAKSQLSTYFRQLGYTEVRVLETEKSDQINRHLRRLSEEKSQNRFKRVYEVQLVKATGERETRLVLAKSVGWGWLSYHAFLAGERLTGFVPSMLGLRNGLLYSEWCGRDHDGLQNDSRSRIIETAASYIAKRVKKLNLSGDPTADLAEEGRHFGCEQLIDYLGRAYGGRAIVGLRRGRLRHEFGKRNVPCPTFTDSRMQKLEWLSGPESTFKSDFEQHGLGKYELSITDPAYDVAEFILNFRLSCEEEEQLINQYVSRSGDADVRPRLFLNKLQAGTWAMRSALSNLTDPRLAHRHEEFHRRYIDAWNFLTIQSAHRCGGLYQKRETIAWKPPFVFLDVDGVLDKHVFGYPSTTAAGIQALALLQNHGVTVALDTARSMQEVKEYCRAYGFAGGIAEYGAWVWDAVGGNEMVLVSMEDKQQLDELAERLRQIPGVFLNDDYQYSLRAFTYGPNGTVPLPTPVIETLMAKLKLDRLKMRQTSIDTTVTARANDKGKGLLALKALIGQEPAETIAVGDTEPDIPMFAVSQRSFAPGNMSSCRPIAKALGCNIVPGRYQVGLLQIAHAIVHPDGGRCNTCTSPHNLDRLKEPDLFLKLLRVADEGRMARLFGALRDPMSYKAFKK